MTFLHFTQKLIVGCAYVYIIRPDSDALGLSGMEAVRLDEAESGLRVVRVRSGGVEHEWVPIAETLTTTTVAEGETQPPATSI